MLDEQDTALLGHRWREDVRHRPLLVPGKPVAPDDQPQRPGVTGVVRSFFAALQCGDSDEVARYVSERLLARGHASSWQVLLGVARIPECVAIMGAGIESARTWVVVHYQGSSAVLQARFCLLGKHVIDDIVVAPLAG